MTGTAYPGGLDNFSNPLVTNPLNGPSHSQQHAQLNDALKAVETELGINPSGTDATVRARLDRIDVVNPASGPGLITIDDTSSTAAASGIHTHTLLACPDVVITSLQDKDILIYNSATGKWINTAYPT